ncbi:pseudouridine synthase, partial [Campylobacter jejuni]|nr:pseudouridine synthase [Campylobacter jejuni]
VHGANSVKNATLVDWLIEKNTLSNLGGEIRAGLVHRLDKDTSGAILIAKNNFTHQKLSEQLADKSMGRIY